MSISEEYFIESLLKETLFYVKHKEENESYEQLSQKTIKKTQEILGKNIRNSFIKFSANIIIQFAETAMEITDGYQIAEEYIKYFFQRNKTVGQISCRALLVKARIIAHKGRVKNLKGEKVVENLLQSLTFVKEVIDIISKPENKEKYSFLIYNTTVCVYNIIRFTIKSDWTKNYIQLSDELDKLLTEVDDADFHWRCRFDWMLFRCLAEDDASKNSAQAVLQRIWTNMSTRQDDESSDLEFQEEMLRIVTHYGSEWSGLLALAKKEAETPKGKVEGWNFAYDIQTIKSGIVNQEPAIEKLLTDTLDGINDCILTGKPVSSRKKWKRWETEHIAECGMLALKHNFLSIAKKCQKFLSHRRQLNQKSYIYLEYIKAQLMIQIPGKSIDPKSTMRLNIQQLKQQSIQRRIKGLTILEKVMITNKKLLNPDLIHEGAILVWNFGVPFLNNDNRKYIYKSFLEVAKLLELIKSNNYNMRVNFHLEIAKNDIADDFLRRAEDHIKKAILLDYSTIKEKLAVQPDENEDPGFYQRPYERMLVMLSDKLRLKRDIFAEPSNNVERTIMELESIQNTKSLNTKIEILNRCFQRIIKDPEQEYFYDQSKDLVKEEIEKEKLAHIRANFHKYREKKLIAVDIAKMAFDWELNDIATKACEWVIADEWKVKNGRNMIISQIECYFMLAQSVIESLIDEGFEIAFQNAIKIEEDDSEIDSVATSYVASRPEEEIKQDKLKIIEYFLKAANLAKSISQTQLQFNGAIYIWNNYLPVFREKENDIKLLPEVTQMLQEYFDHMQEALELLEERKLKDYDNSVKIEVFANMGIILSRILEGQGEKPKVQEICGILLEKDLNKQMRKIVNQYAARNGGAQAGGGKKKEQQKKKKEKPKKPVKGKKGDKKVEVEVQSEEDNSELIFNAVQQIEQIATSEDKNKEDTIKQCFEGMSQWKAKINDEAELEMHSELWARLARLSLDQKTAEMSKYSLKCCTNSLSLLKPGANLEAIPQTRLRWYSIAEYIYAETLLNLLNQDTQEKNSQERLLLFALKHVVEAANKGAKANLTDLVLQASKLAWNIIANMKDSAVNRKVMFKPIYSLIYYMKQCKVNYQPDLVLLLAEVFFTAAKENKEYQLGETVADMAFALIPRNQQRKLWEAKMIFLSKQGKNEMHAIANMKETDPSLQAKVWVKLARESNNTYKQYNSYTKAINLLQNQSVEIVEVLMEFGEWLNRHAYPIKRTKDTLQQAADILIEIELMDDEDEEEDIHKAPTIFSKNSKNSSKRSQVKSKKSRMSRSKKSRMGKSKKSKRSGLRSKKQSSRAGSRRSRSKRSSRKKTAKSSTIFTEREEDPFPDTLNCLHFERLFRIHAMLAMIAQSTEMQIQYALDAKYFLLQMLDLSFKRCNELNYEANKPVPVEEEVVEKKKDEEEKKPVIKRKYFLPEKFEEWKNFTWPKEILESVKTNATDYNILSTFIFDKAELTSFYLFYILQVLEDQGLQLHCVPICHFMKFFANNIIEDKYLKVLVTLRFQTVWHQVNFHEQADLLDQDESLLALNISTHEKKKLLHQSQSLAISGNVKSEVKQPMLVDGIYEYKVWIDIAKQLVRMGQLTKAKYLLEEAEKHAKIYNDAEKMAEIQLIFSEIALLEGDIKWGLEAYMKVQQFIKKVELWDYSLETVVMALLDIKKFDDAFIFLQKIEGIVTSIISKQYQQANRLQLVYLLNTTQILIAFLKIKNFTRLEQFQDFKIGFEYIHQFMSRAKTKGLEVKHMRILRSVFQMLLDFLQVLEVHNDQKLAQVFKILDKISVFIGILNSIIQGNSRHVQTIPSNIYISGPLEKLQRQFQLLEGKCLILQGNVKFVVRQRKHRVTGTSLRKSTEIGKAKTQLAMNKFLSKLSLKIEKESQPSQKRFNTYEKAVAIIGPLLKFFENLELRKFIETRVEVIRAKRLQATIKKQMNMVWPDLLTEQDKIQFSDEEQDEFFDDNYFRRELVKEILKMRNDDKTNVFLEQIPQFTANDLKIYQNFALEMVETFGVTNPGITFEYLARYQHGIQTKAMLAELEEEAGFKFELNLMQKLRQHVLISGNMKIKTVEDYLNKGQRFLETVKIIPDFNVLTSKLPINSSYLIVQFSPNKESLYVSFFHIDEKRKFKFVVDKKIVQEQDMQVVKDYQAQLKDMKRVVTKTPLLTDEDHKLLEEEHEENYRKLKDDFKEFFQFLNNLIDPIINPSPEEKSKESISEDPKKSARKEQPSISSDLPSSNIQSLVLLLDNDLSMLPFESLDAFEKIPAITRDFSLEMLYQRYKAMEFSKETNECRPIDKLRMQYFSYDFKKDPEIKNVGEIYEEFPGKIPGSQIQGIQTSKQLPSLGDWQEQLGKQSLACYYGNPPFLNIVNPSILVDQLNLSTIDCFLIQDRINTRKNIIQKFKALNIEADKVLLHVQPMKTLMLLSLMGVKLTMINQYSMNPHENTEVLRKILETAAEGEPIASSLKKYKKPVTVQVSPDGKIISQRKGEEVVNTKRDERAKGKGKKGEKPQKGKAKEDVGKEEKVEKVEKVEEDNGIVEKQVTKKNLFLDNFIFYGIPTLKLQ